MRPHLPRLGLLVGVSVISLVVGAGVGACSAVRSGPSSPTSAAAASSKADTRAAPKPAASPSRSTPRRTQPPPPPPAPGARSFTVLGTGDVLLHSGLWDQARRDAKALGRSGYEFGPLLAGVRAAVTNADLAICHMETPLAPSGGPFSSYPIFSVPPQIAPALAATGYDSCSTASNHSIDKGEPGVVRTLDALDRADIRHTGTARTPAEAATPNLLTVEGVKVAHLSYTFSFNGLSRPPGKGWLANYLRVDSVLAEARRAKAAGALVVIVSIHWGTEYQHAPNSHQTSVARKLLASPDVDLILGHHAHVVQPLERIGDKWVAYGMGNEVSYQHFSQDTQDGIMPQFTFTEVSPGRFKVTRVLVRAIRMWLDSTTKRLYDVATVLASPSASSNLRNTCRGTLRRVEQIIGSRGGYADGLELIGA